jgi:hypothetical protein
MKTVLTEEELAERWGVHKYDEIDDYDPFVGTAEEEQEHILELGKDLIEQAENRGILKPLLKGSLEKFYLLEDLERIEAERLYTRTILDFS